jgi:hypothetical protein
LDRLEVAHYDLNEIKELLKSPDTRFITRRSRFEAVRLGYASDSDMVNRIQLLSVNEIYKTMESIQFPGLWQDVYRTSDGPIELYIKIQKSNDGKGVIIQFKER